MTMARWSLGICLTIITSIAYSGAQSCGNSGSNCAALTNVSQCTQEVVSQCCTKCNDLAGCFNLGLNCYTDYSSDQCYSQAVYDNCCLFCKHNEKDFLGESCRFGDLQEGCQESRCGETSNYNRVCCGTCYEGTTPDPGATLPTVPPTNPPTAAPATTTSDPNTCTDDLSTCESLVSSVPSSCYSGDLRQRCCQSCESYLNRRQSLGFNTIQCPYGDRSATCIDANFDVESCSSEDISFVCCDACLSNGQDTTPVTRTTFSISSTPTPPRPTGPTRPTRPTTSADPSCSDSGIIECNLPDRFCYASESDFYNQQCCATCRQAAATRTRLPATCLYGDRRLECPILVTDTTEQCTSEQEASCCETCFELTVTTPATTVNPCQDTSDLCPALVGGQGSNCYEIGALCCATCRPFIQDNRPESCRFGDRLSLCTEDLCDSLESSCCATCADVTTPALTTTESQCFDTDDNCDGGLLQLNEANKRRCYNDDVRGSCCGTCRDLARDDSATCAWGDRDAICSSLLNINCDNEQVRDICCGTCGGPEPSTAEPTTVVTTTPMTAPPNCEDTVQQCDMLTANLFNCYADNSFIADGCCATCFSKRKTNLPLSCWFGDRVGFCQTFIESTADFCDDPSVRRDCCESCFRAESTTPVPTTTPQLCSNEWSDDTCEQLVSTLGDCATIQEKCCRTCTVTQTPTTTTVATTTEEVCPNTLPDSVCELIISSEGEAQCYEDFMALQCCRSCSGIITTTTEAPTTTTPACPSEDSLPCLDIQIITEGQNICDEPSAFLDSCCNFCLSGGTVSTVTTTDFTTTGTTIPTDCDGNVFSLVECATLVATSPTDEPCENSNIIANNCCAYCAMLMSTVPPTTTTVTTTSSGPECEGDDPSINCAGLDSITGDVCDEGSLFSLLCCDYCSPDPTTTTTVTEPTTSAQTPGPTTTGNGFCSSNPLGAAQCEALFQSQGGLAFCATNFMLENCCLYCSQVTVATTTPGPTTVTIPPCNGDNIDLNCTSLDISFGDNLCNPALDVVAELRLQCCDYCANKTTEPPTTTETSTSTTTGTTEVCVDVLNTVSCNALANTNACGTDTGDAICCATCREFLATTTTVTEGPTTTTTSVSTTTTQAGTTTACVDSMDINCTSLALLIDPCVGDTRSLCCEFCSNRTTPSSTAAPPTTATLAPCLGDTFPTAVCQERNRTEPNFCVDDDVWINLCCEYCGLEVVTTQAATTAAGTTDAPTTQAPTTAVSTTEGTVCAGNLFSLSLCQNRINTVPDSCDDPEWYGVCCTFCDDLAASARKRRSVDDVASLRRIRRQSAPSCTNMVADDDCEAAIFASTFENKIDVCIETYMLQSCCGTCSRVSASGVLPEGCNSDEWSYDLCAAVVDNEGAEQCSESLVADNCCLFCALASLRAPQSTTTSAPTTTTTTIPTTTAEVVCEQQYSTEGCTSLLGSYSCSSNVIKSICCDFYCEPTSTSTTTGTPTTTTVSPETSTSSTTTQPTTTRTTTAPETTPQGPIIDPIPSCGVDDDAQTCPSYVPITPSGCYQQSVYDACCQSCTNYYYERKAAGFNVEYCSYGNRISNCPSNTDCNDPQAARDCCDVCYPRESVTQRPLVSHLTSDYVATLTTVSPCSPLYSDNSSFPFTEYSKYVRSAMQSMFSVLPGEQIYTVNSISCADEVNKAKLISDKLMIRVTFTTSATHTFSELDTIFKNAVQDGQVGLLEVITNSTTFEHAELFDDTCSADTITNCDQYALSPNSDCYHPDPYSSADVYSRCCVSCNEMAVALYADRAYIPVGCEYGDKADECSADVDCNSEEAKRECCYTCAPEPEDYTTPMPSTTTSTTTVPPSTTTPVSEPSTPTTTRTTTPLSTTTKEPCLGDTSDRCVGLTEDVMSCYNDELVYGVCCQSCVDLARWDLPDSCAWGDKQVWCVGIDAEQCNDQAIFDTCCDTCGPHLTSTTPTSTSTTTQSPTTTPLCEDTRSNCADLTVENEACYTWETDCCASCRDKIIDYLPEDCKFGDKLSNCPAYTTADCVDAAIAEECCQLCGPTPPSSTTSTTMSTTVTTTVMTTTDPGCVADESGSVCSLLTDNGGCYNAQTEEQCCLTCENNLDTDAPVSCRYGDHQEYCTTVTRERCLTEVRVFEDCCKTCEGLVAPPGVCVDSVPNCDSLIDNPSACYTDLIYSQCCYSCEQIARDDLATSCQWGNQATFCKLYTRDDCDTIDGLEEQCCALCTAPVTTTTTEAPPTTTQPQCVDQPTADCTQDTSERRFCYDQGVEDDCCASCKLHQDVARPTCPYGDRELWCQFFVNQADSCDEPLIKEACCLLCAPPPTTTMPTTSACYDTEDCSDDISNCYEDLYKSRCCRTCMDAYDENALFGCEYGDRQTYCSLITKEQCESIAEVRSDCCVTCPILTAESTAAPTTTPVQTTTPTATRTTPATPVSTTPQPQCVDTTQVCDSITPDNCYEESMRKMCCDTCEAYDSGVAECRYGDNDTDFCRADMDCSLSVVRELCCHTCDNYVIPAIVEETFRLKVNVTSHRCTAGLNDRGSNTYLVFKYQIELAVTQILNNIPGTQLASLVDISHSLDPETSCGSVIAILEIQSTGFYAVDSLNRIIMLELADGQLGQLGVSTSGSSLTALSFEPPACVNGDFSLNCLTKFVLTEPSLCFEANVRTQCCRSCSSLYYSRLAAGIDINSCPYGDRDAECFNLNEADCSNTEAREKCCDRCASFTTPSTSPTVPTTTVTTTAPCFDDDANVCAQGVQNSLSFCYEAEDMCCATCRTRRVEGLPDSCAWGDKREFCSTHTRDDCDLENVNSTCCALCGDSPVDPTAQPCLGDINNYECTITIRSNPSRCYDSQFYSECCESCNIARMDWLPSGCIWGDKADFCDSSSTICDVFGDDVCCGSCCLDCVEPTTPAPTTTSTTTSTTPPTTTTVTTTRKNLPAGCNGDTVSTCSSLISNPEKCYADVDNGVVADLCCESCYDIRRQELPASCAYGNRIDSCAAVTLEQCSDGNTNIGSDCCEQCFDLLEICEEEQESSVTNCEVSVQVAGACYSSDVLQNCCGACKSIANFDLPAECRFGNKVRWCGDITADNIDRICNIEEYQVQCCDTCQEYIGMTTTSTVASSTTSMTTSVASTTTTRLPPNEQCPDGDTATDCVERTEGTGACYDPDVSDVCCRTCYEEWRGDLPRNCRYGDKSKYCMTVDDADVDFDWCVLNGDTCCARCQAYLTTTVPTTTLPAECPNGNTLDSCNIRVSVASDCYSPPREQGCCIECTAQVRGDLPDYCRYGDKAEFCQDISESECPAHKETCCEKCAAYLTTTTPTPSSTAMPIVRPSVQIGDDLFNRPVSPGTSMLYQVTYFTVVESCAQLASDSNDYKVDEAKVCTDMGSKFWSLTNCYVDERTCNDLGNGDFTVNYKVMILVDGALNYQSITEVNAQKLEAELLASQSKRKRRSILYFDLSIRDVNECDTTLNVLLRDGCDHQAVCTNTDGSYQCQCPAELIGNGFSCTAKIDPLIGRANFDRDVPPGYHYLYKLVVNLRSTGSEPHGCFNGMNDVDSATFQDKEMVVCSALGEAMDSLYACYVEDFNCDQDFRVTAYIVVDAELNYLDKRVTQTLIRNELINYDGEIINSNIQDVNECSVVEPLITNHCTADATCENSAGLYDCICQNGQKGFVGVSTCLSSTVPPLPVGVDKVSSGLADWTIAVIVVAAVILVAAIAIGVGYGCRKARDNTGQAHEPLHSGEETPPRLGGTLPPLYNSLRSTKAARSEVGSYFYAPQEQELPGYAMKTYGDTYRQSRLGHDNIAVHTFE